MNVDELIEGTDLGAAAAARMGCSRRDFLKLMGALAGTMGVGAAGFTRLVEAADAPKRPPVIWLSGQECTGCTESLLRAEHPTLEALILDTVSLDYNETLLVPAGHWAEKSKRGSMEANRGKYVLVIEGAVPTKDDGIYCKIAGRTMLEQVREAAEGAAAIIAIGSCASWGGIPSSSPDPTGAKGAPEVLAGKTVITVPGCPPNPYNFLSTVLYILAFDRVPALDAQGRPKFAYGRLIHENCERRAHFDAGRFARQFGDEGHRQGWCLYKLGCKGPETYANCPQILFGDVGVGSWPVGTGHPCFGCTEEGIGFTKAIHQLADVKTHAPPTTFPRVDEPVGKGVTPTAAALLGAVGGVVAGAAAMGARNLARAEARAEDTSAGDD